MNNDFLDDFLTEANEHLAHIEDDILTLERTKPNVDGEIINRIFRAVHTVKGGAGFLELHKISDLAHGLETVLGLIRDKKIILDDAVTDALLNGIDTLLSLIASPNDASITIETEIAALAPILKLFSSKESDDKQDVSVEQIMNVFNLPSYDFSSVISSGHYLYLIELDLKSECADNNRDPQELLRQFTSVGTIHDTSPPVDTISLKNITDSGSESFKILFSSVIDDPSIIKAGADISFITNKAVPPSELGDFLAAAEKIKKINIPSPPSPVETAPQQPACVDKHQHENRTIRISLSLLDQIMNLAGELVLIRNQNMQAIASGNMQKIASIGKQLNMVTTELHTSIMRTRMRPVGGVFNRFTRVVRDLAKKLDKEVSLSISGSEVELDKTIIDCIADPLTHLIRNAVDHGIESPRERQTKGKLPTGSIHLQAFHDTGMVTIRIRDDGKGIDPETIRSIAVKKGVLTSELAATLSDNESLELIFAPGFSTAETVTDISGRGVGMDVVKASFQKIGGVVSITSGIGSGTTISIQLPLTLAILPSLIVTVEGLHFALPQPAIDEVLWLHGSEVYQNIKEINQQEVFRLRGKFFPLLHLSNLFKLKKTYIDPMTGKRHSDRRQQLHDRREETASSQTNRRSRQKDRRISLGNSVYIVVLKDGSERFGLLVDTVLDSEEIVVKPLHKQLKKYRFYNGSAVLGDGSIALILDVNAIAGLGGIRQNSTRSLPHQQQFSGEEAQNILLFNIGKHEQFALPLNLITRVEALSADTIQQVKGRAYIDFRGSILPLIYLEKAIPTLEGAYVNETVYIIIPRSLRPIGLVAATILDTVTIPCVLDSTTITHPGIAGTQLINSHLTLFLDIFEVVEAVEPGWFSTDSILTQKGKRVLLVEDSSFYQAMLNSYLRGIGTEVCIAQNGKEALALLTNGQFDGIISDIEMPVMDGTTFARAVRQQEQFSDIPLLAISSRDDIRSREEAINAGFDDFRSKFDIDGMLDTIQRLFSAAERIQLHR